MDIQSRFTHRPTMPTAFARAALGTAFVVMLCSSAFAADAAPQVATAAEHAGYAAASDNIEGVHMHLYHAVNCLVGPDGEGFDANQMNPCQDQGSGAIPDTTDDAKKQALESALATAQGGIATDDLAAAQEAASQTAGMLKADE